MNHLQSAEDDLAQLIFRYSLSYVAMGRFSSLK